MQPDIYTQLKAKGAATVVKVGDATVVLATAQYDPNTGAPAPSKAEQFNLVGIDEQIAALQAQIAALQAHLTGLQAFRADAVIELAKPMPVLGEAVKV